MNQILITLISLLLSSWAFAQDNFELPALDDEPVVDVMYGLQILQWDEELRYLIGGAKVTGNANFNALALMAQREINYKTWGWSFGGLLGRGKAQGSREGYEASNVAYVIYSGQARLFHRLNNRISLGGSIMVFGRTVSWPDSNGISAESGRALNLTPLVDVNVRLGKKWDFYQALGPTQEGSSLWRLGLNYRY